MISVGRFMDNTAANFNVLALTGVGSEDSIQLRCWLIWKLTPNAPSRVASN